MAEQNPFGTSGAGANAFKAAYDRLKAEAEAAKQNIGTNYGAAYQQLRQQGYGMGLGASAQKGLSGGQAVGVQQKVGAQQMGALGNLMQGQEQALRDAKLSENSIYSNALLEGQQAEDYEQQRTINNFNRTTQATLIVNKEGDFKNYTPAQQRAALKALRYTDEEINVLMGKGKPAQQASATTTTAPIVQETNKNVLPQITGSGFGTGGPFYY